MTLHEWRKSPERLSLALDALGNYTIKEMLAVMELEHPAKQQKIVNDGFAATRALGQIEGFQLALDMFVSFGKPLPASPEDISVTWGADLPDSDKPK